MAKRVSVVGSVNLDLMLRVASLPYPGQTVLASTSSYSPGGKGANQAVAAARAGARVQFVGAVGDDAAADRLRAHLSANAVGLDHLTRVPGPSGSAVVVVDAGAENLIVVVPGANTHVSVGHAGAYDCDVLLTQLEIPVPTAVAAAREARSAGAIVMVNAAPSSKHSAVAELAAVTDVVIANEAEAAEWIWPTEHFVTTLGKRGARYTGIDGDFVVTAPSVAAVDSAGAGDVFSGVLAANWPPEPGTPVERLQALRHACAAGALATLVHGAGNCAPDAEAIKAALSP
ncbi:PfkB family carbohydrate kinase [Mycobacterium vicinigordonae]|uniref:Ribokinase n=1 Tax=Mycobacterium vicinigordonae TaxID=1719132 RepID=A0A7D6IPM7_9MYCO|nr:PfkB family carbohydrate kinase [Mycobacterium vicinigordonae]QLL05879.1 ribokinase [Mycobacterium vicinigordonae]